MANDKLDISAQLAMLAKADIGDPFKESHISISRSTTRLMDDLDDIPSEDRSTKKKKKKDRTMNERMRDDIKTADEYFDKFTDEHISDLDFFLENRFLDDESSDLRNNLINLGRKYARDTSTTGEMSEISKAYSGSEAKLNTLLGEIRKDKEIIQKDVDSMRMMRTKNFKTLSELVSSKATYHSTELSIIKEMNNIKKVQFELASKNNKLKADEAGEGAGTSRAIQQLFGLGRKEIVNSVGGFESISGASDISDDNGSQTAVYDDSEIRNTYFANDNQDSDGAKFLKYENSMVEYILLIDENTGDKDIIAEDMHGNIIYDYPLPSNIEELDFVINHNNHTATDNFHRSYKIRYN